MKHRPITSNQNALQFYCNSADADTKIKTRIADWLTSLNTAQSVVLQNEIDLALIVDLWRTTERESPTAVATAHRKHKPIDTAKIVANIETLSAKKTELQNILQINRSAVALISSEQTEIFKQFQNEFIRWVAVQRCKDLTACGEVMPIEVETLWQRLDIRINKWVDGLELQPDKLTLPLLYWSNQAENYRASLAWIWRELANEQFKFVPKSKTDQRPTLKLLGDIETLPKVPKAVALDTHTKSAVFQLAQFFGG